MQNNLLSSSGGLFSGKISSINDSVEAGSRFDTGTGSGKMYRQRYLKDGYFQALALIREVAVRVFYFSTYLPAC